MLVYLEHWKAVSQAWYSSSYCEFSGIKQSCKGGAQGIYRTFTGNLEDFNKTKQVTWIPNYSFLVPKYFMGADIYSALSA